MSPITDTKPWPIYTPQRMQERRCRARDARIDRFERLDSFVLRGARNPHFAALAVPMRDASTCRYDRIGKFFGSLFFRILTSMSPLYELYPNGFARMREENGSRGEDGFAWTLPPVPSGREEGRGSLRGRENRASDMGTGVNIDGKCSTMPAFFLVIPTA
jgi:hypothetical protein